MCICAVGLFPISPVQHKALGEEETYLISPTALAVTSTHIYVADNATQKILSYDKITKEQTSIAQIPRVQKLLISGDNLYALNTLDSDNHSLLRIDFDLSNVTSIAFPTSYPTENILDITISGSTVYVLRSGGNIDQLTVIGNTLNMGFGSTTSTSTLNLLNAVYSELNSINVREGKLVLTTPTCVYELNLSNSSVKEVFKSTNDNILHATSTHVITTSGNLIELESKSKIQTGLTSCSGLASADGVIYLSSSNTHKVFKIESEQLTDLCLNPAIVPLTLSANNLVHIKLLDSTNLYLEPYSVSPCMEIESGTHLTVIGTYDNFYYCMVVGEINNYVYLNRNTSNFETINIGMTSTKFTATRSTKIYSLPSTNNDEKNRVIGTIDASEGIMVKNSTIIENSNGELFYLVEHGDSYGFVRATFVQSTKGLIELTTPCNAKTKRSTTLFENANATGTILTLEKGTRIALKEEIAPTKEYILVEYQDTNGVVYTGYILADDIDPDGLSTLQILGLVLVGTNLTLLLTILLIKKRSKKWKV